MRLKGKKVIVTGAAAGIGLETARRFAEEGAHVVLSDIDSGAIEAAAAEIDGGLAIAADVTDQGQVDGLVAEAISAMGCLDILVNNAGIPMLGGVETLAEADWDRELDVNLKSVYRTGRAAWPHFKAQGNGVILNTASIAGLTGSAGQASYGAAKAGVINLTRCMAIDGAGIPIRVNCICPGFILRRRAPKSMRCIPWAASAGRRILPAASSISRPTKPSGSPAQRSPSTAA